jgi:hypothetical protein
MGTIVSEPTPILPSTMSDLHSSGIPVPYFLSRKNDEHDAGNLIREMKYHSNSNEELDSIESKKVLSSSKTIASDLELKSRLNYPGIGTRAGEVGEIWTEIDLFPESQNMSIGREKEIEEKVEELSPLTYVYGEVDDEIPFTIFSKLMETWIHLKLESRNVKTQVS